MHICIEFLISIVDTGETGHSNGVFVHRRPTAVCCKLKFDFFSRFTEGESKQICKSAIAMNEHFG